MSNNTLIIPKGDEDIAEEKVYGSAPLFFNQNALRSGFTHPFAIGLLSRFGGYQAFTEGREHIAFSLKTNTVVSLDLNMKMITIDLNANILPQFNLQIQSKIMEVLSINKQVNRTLAVNTKSEFKVEK